MSGLAISRTGHKRTLKLEVIDESLLLSKRNANLPPLRRTALVWCAHLGRHPIPFVFRHVSRVMRIGYGRLVRLPLPSSSGRHLEYIEWSYSLILKSAFFWRLNGDQRSRARNSGWLCNCLCFVMQSEDGWRALVVEPCCEWPVAGISKQKLEGRKIIGIRPGWDRASSSTQTGRLLSVQLQPITPVPVPYEKRNLARGVSISTFSGWPG